MIDLKDKITFGEPVLDRFFNGYSPHEYLLVRFANKVGFITVSDLFSVVTKTSVPKATERMLSKAEDIWIKDIQDEMFVYSMNGFSKVVKIVRRRIYEPIYKIETEHHETIISKSHRFVKLINEEEVLTKAFELKEGDKVYTYSPNNPKIETVLKVQEIKPDFLHVYGVLTEDFGAFVNGIFGKSY
ncbi:Hint domain-containing protein [Caldisericum exile]|uniref:Hint domain-containing protein n=1 Tax=Caldisericum exile (strain DSM 21853 / NBRC 104410 / AZM16c01) TaxID=511051 RepID=A0A7U6GDS4_CALEA|nr:Hint domain-containing protein [Caldisericum exile]BAL80543.1 hypothetical protein CSE_04170 [Caldisericum exile AZM16c01]